MNKIDVNNKSISKEFYIELSNKLEEMYHKSKTFGEVTLMGDLIGLLNSKTELKDIKND